MSFSESSIQNVAQVYQYHGIALSDGPDLEILELVPRNSTYCINRVGIEEFRADAPSFEPIKLVQYGVSDLACFFKRSGSCSSLTADDADLVVSMDTETLQDVLDGNITGIMGLWGKADINKGKMPYASALIDEIGAARLDLGL